MLDLVYQSVNRLLSRILTGVRSDSNLVTKCRRKPQHGFVIFSVVGFFSFGRGFCTEWLLRIPRTTFPQRACEAARRIASSHRSSVPAPAIVRCPSSRPTEQTTTGVQFPAPRDRTTRRAFRPARMRRGAVPILPRSSELRRRARLPALDHTRSDLSWGADSVCNRGTADPFESFVV